MSHEDVLVARATDPGWTPLFRRAAALVLEQGGMLSHGAVVARELGLPAVVNVPEATRRLRSGEVVTVDGGRFVVYSSLKAAQAGLPKSFIRLHRSYLVNKSHISSYDKDSVTIGSKAIPRAKDISDEMLTNM